MLTEVASYYAHLNREQAATSAIVFSLSFDDSSSYLASGTSVGHLTIHSTSLNYPNNDDSETVNNTRCENGDRERSCTLAKFDISCDGAINALVSNSNSVFIATDSSLRVLPWERARMKSNLPEKILKGTQVNSLTRIQKSEVILAASAQGTIFRLDTRYPTVDPVASAKTSYSVCLSASPADSHTVLMVRR